MFRQSRISLFTLLLLSPSSSLAATSPSMNFFLDYYCRKPSIINPTIDVAANTCLVCPGAYGVNVKVLPACATGSASVVMYYDTACSNPNTEDSSYTDDVNCFSDDMGQELKAVQYVCKDVADGQVATATTTVSFGSSSLPVAGGVATGNTGGTPTTLATYPSSNVASPTQDSSSSTSDQSGSNGGSSNSSGSGGGGGGLSRSATIAISIGIPVAALIVALLAWQCPKR